MEQLKTATEKLMVKNSHKLAMGLGILDTA